MYQNLSRLESEYLKIMQDEEILESIRRNNIECGCYSCHGIYHTNHVEKMVKKILEEVGESKENIMLGVISARFHDIGCITGKKNHAYKSSIIAKKYLDKYNFTDKEKQIILQAILDHSNGENINHCVGAALLLADKTHFSKERVISGKKFVNYFNANNMLIDKIDVSINLKNIYIDFIVDKGYDPFSLSFWPKSVEIPQKVANFFNRQCIFFINHKVVDFNKFIY